MADLVETAQSYEELMNLGSHDMPYIFENFFITEGWGAKSVSKKKFKLLKEINKQVLSMLANDEKVHFITTGVEISNLEALLVGAIWLQYINRRALIFTDKRILLLQINSKNKPRHLKTQIKYPAIRKISGSLGSCKMKLENGKAMTFSNVPKKDVKFVKTMMEDFKKEAMLAPTDSKGKENLCPYCYTPIEGIPESCPKCFKPFKSPSKAVRLSLMFPGLGDLYLGHRAMGIFELVGAIIVWFIILVSAAREMPDIAALIVTIVIVYALMHGLDALGTWFMSKKGIIPAE
jgi:hypothetical protein